MEQTDVEDQEPSIMIHQDDEDGQDDEDDQDELEGQNIVLKTDTSNNVIKLSVVSEYFV